MSPNGRYFTPDGLPFGGAKYLDVATGAIADVPAGLIVWPVVRDVANDGTALLLIAQSNDPQQYNALGTLALWKPGSDPRTIYSESPVQSPIISANGGRVAFEAIAEDTQRTLMVLDSQSAERIAIASMPPGDYRTVYESFAKPAWYASGTKLVYRTFDEQAQPVAISLWDAATRASHVVLTSPEGFAS